MSGYRAIGHDNYTRLPTFAKPKVGEIWVEMDPRRPVDVRLVEIMSEFDVYTGKLGIKHLATGKISHAQLKRFNGHQGGYAPKTWFDQCTPNTARDVPHRKYRTKAVRTAAESDALLVCSSGVKSRA